MITRLIVIAISVLGLLSACTTAHKMYALTEMEELGAPTAEVDLATYEQQYGEHDGVYLAYERVIEHSGGKEVGAASFLFSAPPSWGYQEIQRQRYIVFNPNADWLTTFSVWTKPDQLYLRITNPDGSRRQYDLNDLRAKAEGADFPDYQFIFPDVQRGSIIETGYMIDFTVGAAAPREHWVLLQHPIPAEEIQFTYACPDWWEYQVKKSSDNTFPHIDISRDSSAHKTLIRADRRDVPAITPEPYAPYFREVADHLQFRITKLKMGGASWEAGEDWHEIGKLIRKYRLKKMYDTDFELVKLADMIAEGEESATAKMAAILQWVRDSIELDGRNRDGNPNKVLKDRKADLFDLTALTSALLREINLRNDYLLVHSATGGYFDRSYISLDQFDFPAVGCSVDGSYYVLLPYIEGLPPGVVPPWFLGQPALKIKPESVELTNLPDTSIVPSGTETTFDLTLDTSGVLTIVEEAVLSGATAFAVRDSLKDLNDEELNQYARDELTPFDLNYTLESFAVHNLDDVTQPLRLSYKYSVDNVVTLTPDEVIFQTGGLFSPLSGAKLIDDPEMRVNDVVIPDDVRHSTTIRLHHPPEWSVASELSDVETANQFGLVRGTYTTETGLLRVDQELHLRQARRPRSEYADLLAIAGPRSGLYVPSIVFTVTPVTADGSDN